MMTWRSATLGGAAMVFIALGVPAAQAASIDWASVPGKDVTLFYPGQTSWESRITLGQHPGAQKFRDGKNCFACHNGDEKGYGTLLVSGKKNEPTPIAGKPGSIVANVKFAEDAQDLYVHLEFKEGNQPDAKMDPKFDTKVTMMLIDSSVPEAMKAGCWTSCHEDSASMPGAKGADRTLYLSGTRAAGADLAKLKANGYYMEYWQARLNPGQPAQAANGIVFDKRTETPTDVTATGQCAGGACSVTLSRKLDAGKKLAAGKTYTVGFAIHAGHTAKRFHYVSYERSLVLGQGTADFVAVKK
jgi:hypothetical protein